MLGSRRFLDLLLILGFVLGVSLHAARAEAHDATIVPVADDDAAADCCDGATAAACFVSCAGAFAILHAVAGVCGQAAAPAIEAQARMLAAVIDAPEPPPPKLPARI